MAHDRTRTAPRPDRLFLAVAALVLALLQPAIVADLAATSADAGAALVSTPAK